MKKLILGLALLALVVLGAGGGYVYNEFTKTYTGEDVAFRVEIGDTFGRINQRLTNRGLISNPRLFHHYAKYKKALTKFRAGTFTIPRGANMPAVLEILVHGQPILTSITIPEGKNMYEIAKLLAAAGVTDETEFLTAVQHPDFPAGDSGQLTRGLSLP
jgi:UPF0755 protein